jgi:hypothetical protein
MIASLLLIAFATSAFLALVGIAHALLSLLATVSVWKTYMAISMKVMLTLLVLIPFVGLVVYLFWGQKKVREAQ